MCGTKYDMVQSDKKLRHVDYHVTTDYADGEWVCLLLQSNLHEWSSLCNGHHSTMATATKLLLDNGQ